MKHAPVYIIMVKAGGRKRRAAIKIIKEQFMDKRGIKPISAIETVFFFIVALVWTIGEDVGSRIALVVIGWLLFLFGVLKLAALFIPMDKKYAATFMCISFAFDMALIAVALTLYFMVIGFNAESEGGMFNDIFMVAMFICLAIAEISSVACNVADNIDRFKDERE